MKTIILSIAALALSMNLKAQEAPVGVKETIVTKDYILLADTIDQSASPDTSIIRIGNQEIQVIDKDHGAEYTWCSDKNKKKRAGKFTGHWEALELGFNAFDKPDYSMYNDNEFMTLDQGKSMEVNLNFYQLNIGLYKSYIGLVSGMGLSFNSYRFDEPYTLTRGNSRTEPLLLETENLSKTKLAVSYLQVPLLLEFQVPVNNHEGRLYISGGVIGGVKIGSHTKVKYEDKKDKNRDGFNINSFKYAATARVGYKDIGLFATYSLTPLFKSGKGPELTPFTIGISFVN